MTEAVLSARGLGRSFQEGAGKILEVLRGVDLEVHPGERIAIVGSSGSGKTTLLQLLGGLDSPDAGVVAVGGRDIHALPERDRCELRNRTLGFIYQFHHLLPEFSALENIMMPQLIAGLSWKEAGERAGQLLDYMRIGHRGSHRPGELSGGEQQRVAIARAVANAPTLLLADEPTGNLDPETASYVFDALEALVRQSGLAALIATHNHELARRMDRRVTISDGKIVDF
jgi:lipoprotein-releasing system ATP-binding protein